MQIGEVLHFLAGPLIGGLIGYFTNFIAIKMLFWPRHEIRIRGHVLPFTPGIIPKRKNQLARVIGEAVAAKVFTEQDIQAIFLSDGMKEAVADSFMDSFYEDGQMHSLLEFLEGVMSEEESAALQEQLDHAICMRVHRAVNRADISGQVSRECAKILREKSQGTLAAKVMNPGRITSISDYMGTHMQQFAKESVETIAMPMLREELAQILVQPADLILSELQVGKEQLRELIGRIYEKFISEYSLNMVKLFDIAALTEQKIIEFQMEEIEELVNQTIRREMQAVINLGAVLGIVIGLVNGFI